MRIEVDRVENPRFASNVSGTLALELWALPFEYAGGAFQGFPLSGGAFDGFGGNRFVAEASFDLPFVAPPPGSWQLVLMLREWTPLGFVTRDFRNFATPFQVESPAPAAPPEAEAGPVAPVAPARIAKPAVKAAPAVAAAPKVAVAPAVVTAPAPVAAKPTSKAKKGAKGSKTAPSGQTASVNTASVDELAGVKGVSRTLAKAIVAGRPYESFDALLRVKGMGPKLLASIRTGFRLS